MEEKKNLQEIIQLLKCWKCQKAGELQELKKPPLYGDESHNSVYMMYRISSTQIFTWSTTGS